MAKKGNGSPHGPERTGAGEPVWVLEGLGGTTVVGLSTEQVYATEDDTRAKQAVKALKENASVAEALAKAETQIPIARIGRVWFLPSRHSLNIDWTVTSGSRSFQLLCEAAVRDEMFDELAWRLGDRFTRNERKLRAGEVIKYPLGCLAIALICGLVAVLAFEATTGYLTGGLVVGGAVVYLIVALVKPETVIELVRTS
jgi:hypothetical protein